MNKVVPRTLRSVREKTRPLSTDGWRFWKLDSIKKDQKEDDKMEATKIAEITKRIAELNFHDIPEEYIRLSLRSRFAAGDTDKAIELLQLQQTAFSGIIQPYDPNITMLGAENRNNVTCYLDALLFAMFAKLSAFECMLKNDMENEANRKLAALLRLWVNMLRSGKLIDTDMMQLIQEALAECGWADAKDLEQQDTSEAFAFITETLQLPLLALQVDLFHQGKGDVDDHKVVHERLLNLAIPPDPEGKGINLEDCLVEYFNNKVDVLRDSLEEKKGLEKSPSTSKTTIRIVTPADSEDPKNMRGSPLQRRWTTISPAMNSSLDVVDPSTCNLSTSLESRSGPRHRSMSLIQRYVVDDEGLATESNDNNVWQKAKHTGSRIVKAVTVPAWQFFRLIPWHMFPTEDPKNDVEVARHFNKRPVVGICLKRYTVTPQGHPIRQNTLIDIPDSLRLPHFMIVNDIKGEKESNGLSREYKLALQSVVCHRGDSLHSGHYISFARVAPKLLTDNRRHEHDPPPDYEEAQWVKFDDLATESRVSYVDIKKALKNEMPYLLFYQVIPTFDVTAGSKEPPSYDESNHAINTGARTPLTDATMLDVPGAISRSTSGYFVSTSALAHSTGPSLRLSSDFDQARVSFDDEQFYFRVSESRRGSVAMSEANFATPGPNSEFASPAVTPQDESTGARLARAAARFTSRRSGTQTRSRPTSQQGENRVSLTMSRLGLGGLTRASKEPLRDASGESEPISDEQTVIVEDNELDRLSTDGRGREQNSKSLHRTKTRNESKSREKSEKDVDKREKAKGKDKDKYREGLPDRECVVI